MEPKNPINEEYIEIQDEDGSTLSFIYLICNKVLGTWIVRAADDEYPYSCNMCGNYTNEATPYCT